jgi:hypothetical protein
LILCKRRMSIFFTICLRMSKEENGGGPPNDENWDIVRHFVKFLKVFFNVRTKIFDSLYSPSNSYFQQLYNVHKHLREYFESGDSLLSNMTKSMKVKYDKYCQIFMCS